MSTIALLLRSSILALAVIPITASSLVRHHALKSKAIPALRVDSVTMTEDSVSVAGCEERREIDLSGAVGDGNDLRSDGERDEILRSIAARDGANVVLVLQKTPRFVRCQAYHCPDEGGLRR